MADTQTASNRRLLLAYAESSRDLVAPLAEAFRAAGFEVQAAPAGAAEADAAIDAARAVVVCWTPAAVASDVVSLRAARARNARKLVPVLLAPCTPPANLGGRFAMADLSGWRGDPSDRAFLDLVHSLHAPVSGRILSGEFWRSRYLTWGSAGAIALGLLAIIANFGDLKQAVDGVFNPAASERALSATDAKVDEVLTLLKQKSSQPLDSGAETALRESIARLLSAQSGARGAAADKLVGGDLKGALADLREAALEGEEAAAALAETWSEVGALAFSQYTWDAISAYTRAVELDPDDPVARSQLGHLYMRTGRLDEAWSAYRYIYETTDDEIWRALAAGSLGQLALRRGQEQEAEEYLNFALEIDTAAGNIEGQAADLSDLAVLHRSRGDLKKAETMFRKALDLQVKADDRIGQAATHRHLGDLMLALGKVSAAEASFRQSLTLGEQVEDIEAQAYALAGLGDVARERKKIDEAIALYLKSLDLAQQISSREIEAITLVSLGDLAEQRGDRTQAIERLRTAMSLYRDMGFTEEASALQDRLAKAGATPHPEGAEN